MRLSLFVFLGAGLGGVLRYWVSSLVHLFSGKIFPIGTMLVNISGSLLMGFLFSIIVENMDDPNQIWRPLVLTGFLGGYTTFSAFSLESISLLESGHYFMAISNIFLSVALCLAATWAGLAVGRLLSF